MIPLRQPLALLEIWFPQYIRKEVLEVLRQETNVENIILYSPAEEDER